MTKKKNFLSINKDLANDFKKYDINFKNPFIFLAKSFHNPGMVFSVLYRYERYMLYESNAVLNILGRILYPFYFFITYYVLSYHIEPRVEIGAGLFLHNRDIVITDLTKIGRNFSCMGQVTIGTNFDMGNISITIGNDVKIGAGAKIIASGKLTIADSVIIGANAVVVKNALIKKGVYVGVPARVISKKSL